MKIPGILDLSACEDVREDFAPSVGSHSRFIPHASQ